MVHWRNNLEYSEALKFQNQNPGIGVGTRMYGDVQNPWGVMLGQLLPSLISGVIENSTIDFSEKSEKKEKTSSDEAIADQIKAEIDEILKKNEVQSVDDLYGQKEVAQNSIDKAEESKESDIQNKKSYEASNINLKNEIESLSVELFYIEEEIALQSKLGNENSKHLSELDAKKTKIEEAIRLKKADVENNNETISKCDKNIKDCDKLIEQKKDRIDIINNSIERVEILMKQLKKVDGRDAIEHLTNDETADISKLIKQYRKADGEKKEKIEEKLEAALQVYVKNPENTNKTFIKFAQDVFNISQNNS